MHFVYVKVPLRGLAKHALDALHQALQTALETSATGSLLSWGTSVPAAGAREDDPGSFHRIDIELDDLEAGLQVLREALPSLHAAPGTELHFTAQGAALQQVLSEAGWGARGPRAGSHRPRPQSGEAF
jgi:hypothetical protein